MATLTGTKPFLASKTNITGLAIALFGVLGMLGLVPADLDAPTLVEALFTAGGLLVTVFRSKATTQIGSAPATV